MASDLTRLRRYIRSLSADGVNELRWQGVTAFGASPGGAKFANRWVELVTQIRNHLDELAVLLDKFDNEGGG